MWVARGMTIFLAMSDSDVQRALTALRLLSDTCTAAIDRLRQPPSTSPLQASAPSCTVLHKDFISLLSLIYTSTTRLTLAFRHSKPAYSAALTPIRELGAHVAALTTCTALFDAHGATLSAEVRLAAREVCESVGALARTLRGDADAGKDNLVRTGAVHDLVDRARRELSENNLAAVRKRWTLDAAILEDTIGEVAEMVEHAATEGEDDEDDDEEWDELGLGSSKKMSEVELDRTKKIQPVLRFSTILHKHVMPDIFSKSSLTDNRPSSATLDSLPSHSHALVLASEELVAALYAPQDPSNIASALSTHGQVIHQLHVALTDNALLPPAGNVEALTEAMGAMSVNGCVSKEKNVRKWFETCFAQIDKLSRSVTDTLTMESSNET